MTMTNYGLGKLTEEFGEVLQLVGKMQQFPELMMDDELLHPDGKQLRRELEKELGDAMAAARFTMIKMGLDVTVIFQRQCMKEALFNRWDSGEDSKPTRKGERS